MLPSFYVSQDKAREWSVTRAAIYGAALGMATGLFKMFGPLHQASAVSVAEIVGAAVGFAVLCAVVAALRNVIARRLIWPQL
jgi:VanZ family protein